MLKVKYMEVGLDDRGTDLCAPLSQAAKFASFNHVEKKDNGPFLIRNSS